MFIPLPPEMVPLLVSVLLPVTMTMLSAEPLVAKLFASMVMLSKPFVERFMGVVVGPSAGRLPVPVMVWPPPGVAVPVLHWARAVPVATAVKMATLKQESAEGAGYIHKFNE